ncbi:MAG: hypothetical protein HKN42_09830, partial [Granulosicoccus sp.]|nr:hypothetical protein [Granulosicoccus sp.]
RLYYGYGKGRASNFINRFYRMPGLHQKVLAKAQALRNNQLMDSNIAERVSLYTSVTSTYASRMPDIEHNASYYPGIADNFPNYVSQSHAALVNYGIPLPPKHRSPKFEGDEIVFRWRPAHDMNGDTITYDLEVSTSPAFESQNLLMQTTRIAESSSTGFTVEKSRIGSGKRYARLIARVVTNPDRFWQTASDRPIIDGEMRVGVMEFTVP